MNDALFAASKILKFLTQPEAVMLVLLLIGTLLLWLGRPRTGRLVVSLAALVLLAGSALPVGYWWMQVLEQRFPRPDLASLPAPDGIIVLGGSLSSVRVTRVHGAISLNQRAERVVELVMLARRFPQARLVHSGGTGDLRQRNSPESEGLKPFVAALGIDPARMEFEERSRNTYENASFSKAQLQPQPGERWLLVTSAAHMPRSVGIFRAVGWEVIPFPVDFETAGPADWWRLDPVQGWYRLHTAARESIGLAVYYLTGHSASLFPGPESAS